MFLHRITNYTQIGSTFYNEGLSEEDDKPEAEISYSPETTRTFEEIDTITEDFDNQKNFSSEALDTFEANLTDRSNPDLYPQQQ